MLKFVEGCEFEEFSKYLAKIGQYAAKGELQRLKAFLDGNLFNLIVFRENDEIIVMQFGMRLTQKSIGKASLETKKTKPYYWGFLEARRISLSFMNFG
jgi:hypothetical protein